MWRSADLRFELIADQTDDPIVHILISTPDGELEVLAEVELRGRKLTLRALDIQGPGRNKAGPANLRVLADAVLERMDLDEIIVEGAVRTTGAGPGRIPRPIRFARRPRAEAGS